MIHKQACGSNWTAHYGPSLFNKSHNFLLEICAESSPSHL
uniref:Uncharacterized protein n=1 Tax=Rhizophora mucronata TaxID=61149 RepID=A0A2P2NZ62_RHIMU